MISLLLGSSFDIGWGLAWLTVGLIFGSLAVSLIGRCGYGAVGDGVALVGAMAAGLLLESFGNDTAWLWGSMALAFLSACVLIGFHRLAIRQRACPTGMILRRVTTPVR